MIEIFLFASRVFGSRFERCTLVMRNACPIIPFSRDRDFSFCFSSDGCVHSTTHLQWLTANAYLQAGVPIRSRSIISTLPAVCFV